MIYLFFCTFYNMSNTILHYDMIGGKIKVNTLQKMFKNGYEKKPKNTNNIDGYNIDKELSGSRAQVYYHPETQHLVINHRGTKGVHDVITDIGLMFNHKSNNRFKHGKKITDNALKKYDTDNVTITGHSLGHAIAQESNKDHKKELITLNGAITPYDKKLKDNEFVIKSTSDPVSMLHKTNKNTI